MSSRRRLKKKKEESSMVNPMSSKVNHRSEVDDENREFHAYCFSLANRIDASIGKDEVPVDAQELAKTLINQVCRRHRCDDETKAVMMVLMISVKTACGLGWFQERESRELLALVDSMWKGFSSPENVASGLNSHVSLIPQVMERFFPFTKLGQILVSTEAEAESNILMKDFHISKNMLQHSPKQKVGLFVFRTEDISKSSCIIHPQEVSFLLNGKGVEKRYGLSMDSGPQCPTNVTSLLNAGSNLLQTIGCFGGSYFIVIALFDNISLPANPLLKDYVHSEVIESNSDCDIIEGPSRIPLSCPISRTRFKLPVKGHACKHLQCFDFWNYVKINTRIPSWRCPHCNQSVCYTDIRVDQNMIKILEEVGCNSTDVVISSDGSWSIATENGENVGAVPETTHEHRDATSFQNIGPTVLDLTIDDNEMETSRGTQVNEQKPCISEIHGLSSALPELPQTLNTFDGQQQFINSPQVGNTRDSAARDAISTNLYPQDRLATNTASFHTSMPGAQSSQFQGSHVTPLRNCLGRTTDLMERWNHIYANSSTTQTQLTPMPPPLNHQYAMQNQRLPTRSMTPAQDRSIPSSVTHPQTLGGNYGGTSEQRHMQRRNPGGSARESMNLTPANTGNWRPQTRMRGSLTPGSTGYDHMIIRPTQPVQTQAQTLPQLQPTPYYNSIDDEIQAYLAQQTEAGIGSASVAEGVGTLGSFWSMPPETW